MHVVTLCIVVMTVLGGSLLLSAAQTPFPVDGAIEWYEDSPLRAVVQLLCLDYLTPTYHAGTIKNLILELGAGFALLVLAIAVMTKSRCDDLDVVRDPPVGHTNEAMAAPSPAVSHKAHITPWTAAQVLVGLYLLWSLASARWSSASDFSIRGTILLSVFFLWSFCLARGLNGRLASVAAHALVVTATLTSAIAIWYYYGRNPTLRAKFPFGNPTFLAACLIPGIVLAVSLAHGQIVLAVRTHHLKPILAAVALLVALLVCLWVFYLTGSRGAAVGLVFGLLCVSFFSLRGRAKLIPVLFSGAVVLGGWLYFSGTADTFSATGRSATLRLRQYAWSYAWRMFTEKPLHGYGQGGFVLQGDAHAVDDVLHDPPVFEARIAHAHNEWLEVMADLGAIGIALLCGALFLTLWAGVAALARTIPPSQRWALIGLMGALVGFVVEESFGVGLRTSGVPTFYYTVVGLIWAISRESSPGLSHRFLRTRWGSYTVGIAGVTVAVAVLAISRQDFAAARYSYRSGQALQAENYQESIRLAERATGRLNPQRALSSLYRLSEAHLRAAEYFQVRAHTRVHRAYESEPPNPRILALADKDYQLSNQHCESGSGWLKELVVRSPGYMNHGRLAYRLDLTRANNAAVQNDPKRQEALLRDAAVAAQRELKRQPFDPSLSVDYVRAYLSVVGSTSDSSSAFDLLARPLRYHRVDRSYFELLNDMAADSHFTARFNSFLAQTRRALTSTSIQSDPPAWLATWIPEKLRLAAAVRFLQGDYGAARKLLEVAVPLYEHMVSTAPLGAAACYAELTDYQFFSEPGEPEAALQVARKAIALAPESLQGRKLKLSIKTRMVAYYLADNREDQAKQVLRETVSRLVREETLLRELGARYRQLCESLLKRREAGGFLRKPPTELVDKLRRWITRAMELNPGDPHAHYIAADLAFYVGDDKETTRQLRDALRAGLDGELAVQFLQVARKKRPESQPLNSLWNELVERRRPRDAAGDSGPSPPDSFPSQGSIQRSNHSDF